MERVEVTSSHLKSVGHTDITKTLEIEFQDGNIYQYTPVGNITYQRLMKSDSKGKFYNRYIRGNKNYTGTKITDSKLERSTVDDKYWVVSKTSGKVVDARNSEEAAWSRAEVMAGLNLGNDYHVIQVLGTVSLPKPTPIRVRY